jgi:hypothetical protein
MTRKDYIALAAIIKNNHDVKVISPNNFRFVLKSDFINDLTAYLQKDNSRFDRSKFIAACGIFENQDAA